MAGFYTDENQKALVDPAGLRPTFGSAGIISCTMSASTQELTIPAAASGQANSQNQRLVMISTSGQPALVAFDVAGQSASYTSIANMLLVPANWMQTFAISSLDTKVYVLQAGTAGSFQLTVLKTA